MPHQHQHQHAAPGSLSPSSSLRTVRSSKSQSKSASEQQSRSEWRDARFKGPESPVLRMLWRWKLWLSVSLPLSMMDPWEVVLIITLTLAMLTLVIFGIVKYLPQNAFTIYRRARFYLYGQDAY